MNPFAVKTQFEEELARYTGAPYAVAVDSCTNAIFLALLFSNRRKNLTHIKVPRRTYLGVAQSVINAGMEIEWTDEEWEGWYWLEPTAVMDSAKYFREGMYTDLNVPNAMVCLSFHIAKKLPIGRGGAILCHDAEMARWFLSASMDGRIPGEKGSTPTRVMRPGYHMYMEPVDAARGLRLLFALQNEEHDDFSAYPDISGMF